MDEMSGGLGDMAEALPRRCECGGRMVYERDFGRLFSCCEDCTPVVEIPTPSNRYGTPYLLGDTDG